MIQFDSGQQPTANAFPTFGEQQPAGGACTLGPSNQSEGVVINVFNALIDLQLFFRDSGSPQGYAPSNVLAGFAPQSQVFPRAVGFVARSHVAGTPAAVNAQVWEVQDGPLPQVAIPILGTLNANGTITPGVSPINGLTGVINSAGAILYGSGFSVTYLGTGLYQINFDTPFAAPPDVVVTARGPAYASAIATQTIATIELMNPTTNSPADSGFQFIAIAIQ